jgi:hypothetical protein
MRNLAGRQVCAGCKQGMPDSRFPVCARCYEPPVDHRERHKRAEQWLNWTRREADADLRIRERGEAPDDPALARANLAAAIEIFPQSEAVLLPVRDAGREEVQQRDARADAERALPVPREGRMTIKVVVTGTRRADTPEDVKRIERALDALHKQYTIAVLAHGEAAGVDLIADAWAKKNGIEVRAFPADWKYYKNAAGVVRNREMLDAIQPDLVAAFPLVRKRGESSGTWDCIAAAVERTYLVRIYPLPMEF